MSRSTGTRLAMSRDMPTRHLPGREVGELFIHLRASAG